MENKAADFREMYGNYHGICFVSAKSWQCWDFQGIKLNVRYMGEDETFLLLFWGHVWVPTSLWLYCLANMYHVILQAAETS